LELLCDDGLGWFVGPFLDRNTRLARAPARMKRFKLNPALTEKTLIPDIPAKKSSFRSLPGPGT
jgi:hypothetical protein